MEVKQKNIDNRSGMGGKITGAEGQKRTDAIRDAFRVEAFRGTFDRFRHSSVPFKGAVIGALGLSLANIQNAFALTPEQVSAITQIVQQTVKMNAQRMGNGTCMTMGSVADQPPDPNHLAIVMLTECDPNSNLTMIQMKFQEHGIQLAHWGSDPVGGVVSMFSDLSKIISEAANNFIRQSATHMIYIAPALGKFAALMH